MTHLKYDNLIIIDTIKDKQVHFTGDTWYSKATGNRMIKCKDVASALAFKASGDSKVLGASWPQFVAVDYSLTHPNKPLPEATMMSWWNP